jgi:hypothetical protein
MLFSEKLILIKIYFIYNKMETNDKYFTNIEEALNLFEEEKELNRPEETQK